MNKLKRNTKFNRLRNTKTRGIPARKESKTRTIFSVQFMRSRSFFMLLVLFIFILILAFFFGEGGLIEIIKARNTIDKLKVSITQLEKEKEFLTKEIRELKNNPMALEKKAREKLWLMKKNEKVVVIVREKEKE
ncbi:MAG: septum formation initiator family protein [bacterium]|nr:septum formation initiator family protein [bacterium]